MIGKIVELDNKEKYLIVLEQRINEDNFYIANKLVDDKYTNEFKAFLERKKENDIFLEEVVDEELLKVLVNSYVLNEINKKNNK